MTIKDMTLLNFINQLGSENPTPGGGSVAALISAMSAALVTMVASLTVNKVGYEGVQVEMQEIKLLSTRLSEEFLMLADEDCKIFKLFMDALHLPKTSDQEVETRQRALQQAYKDAAEVPLKIGELANQLFDLTEKVISGGNKNAITDGLMAAMLVRCAIRSAFLNVRINLKGIKDTDCINHFENKMKSIEKNLEERENKILTMYPI